MEKKKIGGCVVLYNPMEDVLSNINTYLPFLEWLVVVDNSTEINSIIERIKRIPNVIYVSMDGNKGIASALNTGLNKLAEKGMDLALTMDQDSKFPLEDSEEILSLVNFFSEDYSIVGLNFNYIVDTKTNAIVDAECWLTSGNFVRLDDFQSVGGFSSQLFIDYVDIEFNYKIKRLGKKLGYLRDYSLNHSIGKPIEINLLHFTFYSMNHSPIRYYYRYRNSRYLYLQDKKFYGKYYWKEIFVNLPKMLLYEPYKRKKIRMILKGLRDGRKGRLGPYIE